MVHFLALLPLCAQSLKLVCVYALCVYMCKSALEELLQFMAWNRAIGCIFVLAASHADTVSCTARRDLSFSRFQGFRYFVLCLSGRRSNLGELRDDEDDHELLQQQREELAVLKEQLHKQVNMQRILGPAFTKLCTSVICIYLSCEYGDASSFICFMSDPTLKI